MSSLNTSRLTTVKRAILTNTDPNRIQTKSYLALWLIILLSPFSQCLAKPLALVGLEKSAWVDTKNQMQLNILAQTDHDLYFLFGYFHAKDRFFQMDISRKRILGQLAELLGEKALEQDFRNRLLNVEAASQRSWELLDADTRSLLRAYSQGVNAYLSTQALPSEYQALNLSQTKPWRPVDSIAIMKGIVIELSLRLDIDRTHHLHRYLEVGKKQNFDGKALYFEDTHPVEPISKVNTYQTAGVQAPYSRIFQTKRVGKALPQKNSPALPFVAEQSLMQLKSHLAASPLWQNLLTSDQRLELGSNWWAITGSKSATGKPIIASDPHLKTTWPGLFYSVHLRVTHDDQHGPLHVGGASFPGVPAIAHGQNKYLAWVSTNNPMDVSDIFIDTLVMSEPDTVKRKQSSKCLAKSHWCILTEGKLHPVEFAQQEYRVNYSSQTHPDRVQLIEPPKQYASLATVPFRTHGPILKVNQAPTPATPGQAMVLQYTALAGTREIQAFSQWLRAKNINEFELALKNFEVGSQNWLVADKNGDVAYFASAKLPLRRDLEKGQPINFGPAFIRPGHGEANWLRKEKQLEGLSSYQVLPQTQMPHILNPPSGILINANNDPTGQTIDGNLFNQTRASAVDTDRGDSIYYLSHEYADGLRAERISQRLSQALAQKQRLTPLEVKKIQLDSFAQDATYLLPHLFSAYENYCPKTLPPLSDDEAFRSKNLCANVFLNNALKRLSDWDLKMISGIDLKKAELSTPDANNSIAALYYHLWRALLIKQLIQAPVEQLQLPAPSGRYALRALVNFLNQTPFSCTLQSGIDFCPQKPSEHQSLDATTRRDIALLSTLANIEMLLESPSFQKQKNRTGISAFTWGTLHRQKMISPFGADSAFSIPNDQILKPFISWGGYPINGGYEVINATGTAADAISPEALVSSDGPARRTLVRVKESLLDSEIISTSVIPTARRASWEPQKMLQNWIENKQTDVMAKETFMRLKWQKFSPAKTNHP